MAASKKIASKQGIFIVFEGIDGSGKSTQAARLAQTLSARHLDVTLTREPTDGVWGRKIRNIARAGRAGTSLEQEISYFIEDRKQHVREVIHPALRRGGVVICDRYYYSTIAYQGALGADPERLRRLNEKTHRFPKPDIVFYIDVSPSAGIRRINTQRDGANAGYERAGFLTRVRAGFDALDDACIIRVKGTRPRDAVAREILAHVDGLMTAASG